MSFLALDVGNKRVWVAYSIERIALPYKIIPRVEIIKELKKIISEKAIKSIVIGIPYTNTGLSKQALKIKEFSNKLVEVFPEISFHFVDERFTTAIPRREIWWDELIDLLSAQMILESYLSQIK